MEFIRIFNFFYYKLLLILRQIFCVFFFVDVDYYDDDNYDEGSRGVFKGDGEEFFV